MKLVSPWINHYLEINEMFRLDPDVHVLYSDDDKTVRLYVDGQRKADALAQLLPEIVDFGNVTLMISVIPANAAEGTQPAGSVWEDALSGNGAFSFTETVSGIMSNPMTYVVFAPRIVQYYSDDLGDYYGLRSCLYQDIARDVFLTAPGVFYCTDRADGYLNAEQAWP